MYKLKIITSTTRPGRKGPIIAKWIQDVAAAHSQWDIELIDLAELNLPMMDEPNHPRFRNYQNEYTKRWSIKIDEADAFIFVAAEYNYSYTAPLKNALDYLMQEWANKPAGIVSYGGVSAGTRASNALRAVLTSVNVMPITQAVAIPFFTQFINESNIFVPNEPTTKGANIMLAELLKWATALKPMRRES